MLAWLVPHETAVILALRVLCTPYNHAPCHFMPSHVHKMHAYLAVTCHLHFWQNDRDLLRATAVTRGVERIPKCESAQKVDCGEESSPATPAGIRTRDHLIANPFMHACTYLCVCPYIHLSVCLSLSSHAYIYTYMSVCFRGDRSHTESRWFPHDNCH